MHTSGTRATRFGSRRGSYYIGLPPSGGDDLSRLSLSICDGRVSCLLRCDEYPRRFLHFCVGSHLGIALRASVEHGGIVA